LIAIPARLRWLKALSLLPLLALLGFGLAATRRGYVSGLWLAPWELAVLGGALALLWFPPASAAGRVPRRSLTRATRRR
jgi:hypothetical protein